MSPHGLLTTKLFGSCNRSAQVPGHPEVAYEFPAQSPQNVMSVAESQVRDAHKAHTFLWLYLPKMMDMLMKNLLSGLQFVGRSLAEGIPQWDGFGAPARISCGIAAR